MSIQEPTTRWQSCSPLTSAKQDKPAVEFLIETYRAATKDIALLPTGPLTNIAAAIALGPKFVERVPEIVIMGGAHHHGNVTPAAEFNIWADADAAASVLAAGFRKLVMVPLDATHQALVSTEACEKMAALGTPASPPDPARSLFSPPSAKDAPTMKPIRAWRGWLPHH